jgi:hypothetical protein
MSRGLGKLQREILDALPAYELPGYPGVYDLRSWRLARAPRSSASRAAVSRAVRTLLRRQLLTVAWEVYGSRYVRLDDKR